MADCCTLYIIYRIMHNNLLIYNIVCSTIIRRCVCTRTQRVLMALKKSTDLLLLCLRK
jgi:hypothetical protein